VYAFNQTNVGLFSCSLLLIIVKNLKAKFHAFILEGKKKISWALVTRMMKDLRASYVRKKIIV
jgi:hypothetical protein